MESKLLLTRGTSWRHLRDWRVLDIALEPNLLTCRLQAEMSAVLTPIEAALVTRRRFPDAELYMWDDPGYIPGNDMRDHKAVRVVGVNPWRIPSHA